MLVEFIAFRQTDAAAWDVILYDIVMIFLLELCIEQS